MRGDVGRRITSREALERLRDAYGRAEPGALRAAYVEARQRTLGLRALLALIERVYPVGGLLAAAEVFDRHLREDGLSAGCARSFELLNAQARFLFAEGVREVVASSPVVFYGNHPTILTPFLVAAAVRRDDVRILMLRFAGHVIPGVRPYMLPLDLSDPSSFREWRRGGRRRATGHLLTGALGARPRGNAAYVANRQALEAGALHVAAGGCAMIFPGGGGRDERRWYGGIGDIARRLAESGHVASTWWVPVHEELRPKGLVYRLLAESIEARETPRSPAEFVLRLGRPRRIADIAELTADREEIARRLQMDYEREFPPPERRQAEPSPRGS